MQTILTISKTVIAALALATVVLLQVAAFSPSAHAATADAAKAKKKAVKVKAPQNCSEAVVAVNNALRDRAVPRYRLKTAKGSKARKTWKKKVKAADKKVAAARASLTVQCQGAGTTSALDAECAITFTKLDKLIGLEYDRKMQLRKVKGNSKKAKNRKKVLRKRLKLLGDQIKAENTTFAKACTKTTPASNNGGNGGSGNTGTSTDTADTMRPGAVTITGPSSTNDNTPTFLITAPEGETGGHIECKIDSGSYVTVTSVWTTPVLSDGTHTITCHYVDAAGNVGDPTTVTVTIDSSAPSTGPGISVPGSGSGGQNNGDTPTVVVTPPAGETDGHLECKISGNGYNGEFVNFTPVDENWVLPVLPEGTYTITCHYIDEAGNISPDTTYTLTIDRTAPGAPTVTGPGNPTNDNTPIVTITTTEPGGTIKCSLDGSGSVVVTSPVNVPTLADGSHTISCTQTDAAGNTSPAGQTTIVVDTTAPGAVTISGPNGATSDTTPSFNLSGAAQGDTYACKTDSGSFAASGAVYTTSALPDGSHTVTCHLVDAAGNVGPDGTYTVVIDTTAPSAVVITGPSGLTNDNTPTYTLTGGTGGSFQCKVDGGAFAAAASPYTTAALSEGAHTITCRAVDATGNLTAEVSKSITVDTVAPTVTITDGAPRWDGKHDFTFSSNEAGTSFQCKIDGGAYAAATSPYTTAVLANGSHTFTCIGTDAAGNATAPVVKAFGVFKDPATVSKTGGFQWGVLCTGSATLNSVLGCPDTSLTIDIPANPNGITGNYTVDLAAAINGLSSTVGFGSSYTLNIIVDGNSVASDSATVIFDLLGIFKTNLSASKNNLSLSAASGHTIQLSLKSSSVLSVLPTVSSSSLSASIHH